MRVGVLAVEPVVVAVEMIVWMHGNHNSNNLGENLGRV